MAVPLTVRRLHRWMCRSRPVVSVFNERRKTPAVSGHSTRTCATRSPASPAGTSCAVSTRGSRPGRRTPESRVTFLTPRTGISWWSPSSGRQPLNSSPMGMAMEKVANASSPAGQPACSIICLSPRICSHTLLASCSKLLRGSWPYSPGRRPICCTKNRRRERPCQLASSVYAREMFSLAAPLPSSKTLTMSTNMPFLSMPSAVTSVHASPGSLYSEQRAPPVDSV
mmetsp:Transcript_9975/g.41323  ORF Transcript_9975/g.41323 Transcript_9975/m.41323 type:complete len:226 (+) Transcript_9975:833-1510(+)